MEEKQKFWKKLTAFVSGKGFYAVLALCLVVIGASAFTLVGSLKGMEGTGEVYYAGEDQAAVQVTPAPTQAPAPTQTVPAVRNDPEEILPGQRQQAQLPEVQQEPETETVTEQEDGEETQAVNAAPRGWIWPVAGEVVLEYAPDYLVWNVTMADWRTHPGMDIAASMGTKVLAVSGGMVTEVGEDDMLGTYVVVDHGEALCSLYANLAAVPAVTVGDQVEMGDVIGSVGDTSLAEIGEEAHLHFAMTCNGEDADPQEYLPER